MLGKCGGEQETCIADRVVIIDGHRHAVETARGWHLTSGSGNDVLSGNEADNNLNGGLGDDEIYGRAGNDSLEGGGGADIVYGAGGNDSLTDESGASKLYGDTGGDHLVGSSNSDVLSGAGGKDIVSGEGGDDRLIGGADDDHLAGDAGNDQLRGGPGDDELDGGDGLDDCLGGDGSDHRTACEGPHCIEAQEDDGARQRGPPSRLGTRHTWHVGAGSAARLGGAGTQGSESLANRAGREAIGRGQRRVPAVHRDIGAGRDGAVRAGPLGQYVYGSTYVLRQICVGAISTSVRFVQGLQYWSPEGHLCP